MAVDPIKLDIRNAQFMGDVICMSCVPRDMAAVRRCTECLFEAVVPNKKLEPALPCPNCGRQTLAKKFKVRVRTYDVKEDGSKEGKVHFMAIFAANPYIDDFDGEPDMVLRLGTNLGCKGSNSSGEHITQAYRKAVIAKTGFQFPQGLLRPDLHLSEHEINMPRLVDGRYWVICIGKRPPFTSKYWPAERWQKVVENLPEITFVQVGHSDHEHVELQGDNVINMIGKTQDQETGIRDLFRLVYHSDGCCSLVSSLMHIAAGFEKPCVVIAGAREPIRFEQYAFHRYLANQGSMKCEGITPGEPIAEVQITDTQMLDSGMLPKPIMEKLNLREKPLGHTSKVIRLSERGDAWLVDGDQNDFYIGDHEGDIQIYEAKNRQHGGITSCWKSSKDACPNLEEGYPKCIMMISVSDVTNAIKSYYAGAHLEPIQEKATVNIAKQPTCKIVCNAHAWGGGERSASWLANRMLLEGYEVHLVPTGNVNDNFRKELSPYVKLNEPQHPLTEPCDLLINYTNDMVFGFSDKYRLLEMVNAKRKVMVLNYRLGAAGKLEWTKHWSKYIFLCSDMQTEFKSRVPDCNSVVLPPPVDLKPFLDVNFGSLNRTLHVVRVGSQSSQKFPPNIKQIVQRIKEAHPSVSFTFMGGHPALNDLDYVTQYDEYSESVIDVLRKGTVFWYILPYEGKRYLDNGPRVIMEAMAAGLPIVADNWGGAADRITPETGWLCDSVDEHVNVFAGIDGKMLNTKGQAAKDRARSEFDPDRWVVEILDG